MKKNTQNILIDKIHNLSLKIFKAYNQVVRTPVNWKKERERLLTNSNSRALWEYKVPPLKKLEKELIDLGCQYQKSPKNRKAGNIYSLFAPDVVEATFGVAQTKLGILKNLRKGNFQSDLKLRKRFYQLDFDYSRIEENYEKVLKAPGVVGIGKQLAETDTSPEKAAEIIRDSLDEVRKKIDSFIDTPMKFRSGIIQEFNAEVEIRDDPSFSMRCITEPKTGIIKILLSQQRKYSQPLIKIAYLHEFCGHALESAVFDKTFVPKGITSKIFSYAGVSSPSIFDVKAEVLADRIVAPFLTSKELKFVNYRREVWLICRAMADYLYHIKKKTIEEITEVFTNVGLESFAFDEAIMASIFISGYQGMYLFANKALEERKTKLNLSEKDFLTTLLFMGKTPISKFNEFSRNFQGTFI